MKNLKIILLVATLAGAVLISCEEIPEDEPAIQKFDVTGLDTIHTETGMSYIRVKDSISPAPQPGDTVAVHYNLYNSNMNRLRSTRSSGVPLTFIYDEADFIEGFRQGIDSMTVGDKFRLLIPYYLGYGESGTDKIPPYSDLVYDVEMLEIRENTDGEK